MKAVIMAGGKGTRIRSVASDIPKPMIPVLGKPILRYQIENLVRCGIKDIILVTGYLSEAVTEYFGDGKDLGAEISYFNEDKPMGTAGALYYLKEDLKKDFLLLMGDLMLSVDFNRFMEAHKSSKAKATLFVHPNSHPYDSDIIVTEETGRLSDYTKDVCAKGLELLKDSSHARQVTGFIGKKDKRDFYYHNQVNAGIYALSPEIIKNIPKPVDKKIDLDKEIIRPLILRGGVFAYNSTEYVKDMGTPDRYEEVTKAVESGLVEKRNLSHKQKCVFIDRDGTLNVEKGFISDPHSIELYEGAVKAVRMLNASEYLCVLITNQPVVARGEVGFSGLDEIFKCIDAALGEKGAYLDKVYFCPHHPRSGYEGEIKELKFECCCRKPETGMILKAANDLNIELEGSYMIGDSTGDIMLGKNARLKTIGLKTGMALGDGKHEATPDHICDNLYDAVRLILGDNGLRRD